MLCRPNYGCELRHGDCENRRRFGSCAFFAAPIMEFVMRVTEKGLLVSALILSLSGVAYAQGAGGGAGTGGGGGTAGGNGAGQGGAGMGTPNANGVTGSPSGASGSSTMGTTSDDSKKPMKKGGGKDSPVPGGTKKAY